WEYLRATRHQRLYHPFGAWNGLLGGAMAKDRESIDDRFCQAQSARWLKKRQQKGNRERCSSAEARREGLFKVGQEVWKSRPARSGEGRGRPSHRKNLRKGMLERGISLSRRDLEWLMKALQSRV